MIIASIYGNDRQSSKEIHILRNLPIIQVSQYIYPPFWNPIPVIFKQVTDQTIFAHSTFENCTQCSKIFLDRCILTVVYFINWISSRVFNFQTLFQVLIKHYPSSRIVSKIPLKIFGCSVLVHIHSHNCWKLNSRAIKCIFLGYSPN